MHVLFGSGLLFAVSEGWKLVNGMEPALDLNTCYFRVCKLSCLDDSCQHVAMHENSLT